MEIEILNMHRHAWIYCKHPSSICDADRNCSCRLAIWPYRNVKHQCDNYENGPQTYVCHMSLIDYIRANNLVCSPSQSNTTISSSVQAGLAAYTHSAAVHAPLQLNHDDLRS